MDNRTRAQDNRTNDGFGNEVGRGHPGGISSNVRVLGGSRTLRLRLFGAAGVIDSSGRERVASPQTAALLALMACTPGVVIREDSLLDHLWPNDRRKEDGSGLRTAIGKARALLDGALMIDPVPNGYVLLADPHQIDTLRFRRLITSAFELGAAHEDDAAIALRFIDSALVLRRGEPFGASGDSSGLRGERQRLDSLAADAEELRVDCLIALGSMSQAIDSAHALVEAEPLRERRWAQLMLALAAVGRRVEALREFQRARTMLLDIVGVAPGAALVELEAAIVQGHPTTDLATSLRRRA